MIQRETWCRIGDHVSEECPTGTTATVVVVKFAPEDRVDTTRAVKVRAIGVLDLTTQTEIGINATVDTAATKHGPQGTSYDVNVSSRSHRDVTAVRVVAGSNDITPETTVATPVIHHDL